MRFSQNVALPDFFQKTVLRGHKKAIAPARNDRFFEIYQQKALGLAESCRLVSVAADRLGGAGSAAAALMGASSEEESSRSKDGDSKNSFHENRFE